MGPRGSDPDFLPIGGHQRRSSSFGPLVDLTTDRFHHEMNFATVRSQVGLALVSCPEAHAEGRSAGASSSRFSTSSPLLPVVTRASGTSQRRAARPSIARRTARPHGDDPGSADSALLRPVRDQAETRRRDRLRHDNTAIQPRTEVLTGASNSRTHVRTTREFLRRFRPPDDDLGRPQSRGSRAENPCPPPCKGDPSHGLAAERRAAATGPPTHPHRALLARR